MFRTQTNPFALQNFFGLVLLLFATICQSGNHLSLPDIGDPSYSAISTAEERKLGRVVLAQLRNRLNLVAEIELQNYIRSMGQRILSQSDRNGLNFQFLLVKDKTINAFATPGGIIAMNSGLILSADNEAEVAGVLAHEIAHVNRRHIARLYALSSQAQWLNAFKLVASLIAASYNADLGRLGLASAASSPIEKRLTYSRIFEREADQFGMRLLHQAGYDVQGMVVFFAKLQARSKGYSIPEFLRTHPLDIERLKTMQQQAAQYPQPKPQDQKMFQYVQATLRALLNTPQVYKNEAKHIRLYRQGVTLLNRNAPYEAIQNLKQIKGIHRNDIMVQLAMVKALMLQNKNKKAQEILDKLAYAHPNHIAINYYLAELLLRTDKPRKAFDVLQSIRSAHPYYPSLLRLSARAAAMLKNDGLHHEYLAEYYAANGKLTLAVNHFKLADQASGNNSVIKKRIEQKRKSILELQKEMKK